MSEFELSASECSHDNLRYGDIDVCEPDAVYENWYCEDCGATVVKVLRPSHWIVEPREDDEAEQYEMEVNP